MNCDEGETPRIFEGQSKSSPLIRRGNVAVDPVFWRLGTPEDSRNN
jgi:hypothetical protein